MYDELTLNDLARSLRLKKCRWADLTPWNSRELGKIGVGDTTVDRNTLRQHEDHMASSALELCHYFTIFEAHHTIIRPSSEEGLNAVLENAPTWKWKMSTCRSTRRKERRRFPPTFLWLT